MNKKRKGMTLIEVIGVLIIIAIITALVGFSVSRNVKRGNRESVVSELELYATSLADAYYDLGSPEFDPATQQAEFDRYLTIIESDYMSIQFDHTSITPIPTGFTVKIASPIDIYEQQYQCWFVTAPDVMKYVMVACGGENCKIESEGYAVQDYKDDIVLVVRPKV